MLSKCSQVSTRLEALKLRFVVLEVAQIVHSVLYGRGFASFGGGADLATFERLDLAFVGPSDIVYRP
jgi:hypothetical protein